ncbi:MAG: hypothetical protein OXC99_09210 [Chloroflexi bacterium]|nr:hypothetical protein [Chloroflexota bacterium]
MPATMRNTLLVRLAPVAVGSIVGLSIVLVVACTQGDAECLGAYVGEAEGEWALSGGARLSGSSTIVACVNGLPITAADMAAGRAQVAMNLEHMRDALSRVVPDSEFRIGPEGTTLASGEVRMTSNEDGPIPESFGLRELMGPRIELIEQHGVDTVVLASAILNRALFTAATAAGHSADDAEIADRVAQFRAHLAEGQLPEWEAYLSTVDKEAFFTEVLPGSYAQREVVGSWRWALFAENIIPPEDFHGHWPNVERDALSDARITLSNESGLDATIRSATAYLEDYWAFVASPTPTPTR